MKTIPPISPDPLTYRRLLNVLKALPENDLDTHVSVLDADEEVHQAYLVRAAEDDVLDQNHLVIKVVA